jgi:hypothetical protein
VALAVFCFKRSFAVFICQNHCQDRHRGQISLSIHVELQIETQERVLLKAYVVEVNQSFVVAHQNESVITPVIGEYIDNNPL